jgi:hypothetical protein
MGTSVRENLRAKIYFGALKIPDGDMLSGERSSGEKVIGAQLEKSASAHQEKKSSQGSGVRE